MEVKPSPIHGLGLFADRNYQPNEEIIRFKGNPKQMIYINHSCLPTCYTVEPTPHDYQTHVLYAGDMGLAIGEEITYDYRKGQDLQYWQKTVGEKCNCPKCRNEKAT